MTATGKTTPQALPPGGHPPLRAMSFCTGMAGDKAAYQLAGIDCEMVAVAEIAPLPAAVLAQKFPRVPNLGDITSSHINWSAFHDQIDILTAGLPCQPHSIAGRRGGTGDSRDLTAAFCDIVEKVEPEWILVENVEGYRTSEGGKAYRTLTGRLRSAGYAVADSVIDARDFVPQRRKRLWILAHRRGSGTAPETILARVGPGAWRADAGKPTRQEVATGVAGGASVLYPPRLGTLVASGAGLSKRGMRGAEFSFLVVQIDPEAGLIVRRPTPLEALRAQGFPDNWTLVAHRGKPVPV